MKDPEQAFDPFEQAFLTAYPNPDRVGCPGDEVLRGLASKRLAISHPARMHIVECSPCWREFRSLEADLKRAELKRKSSLTLLRRVAALVVLSFLSFWVYRYMRLERTPSFTADRQNHGSVRTPPGILNYQTIAVGRGGQDSVAQPKEQIISRAVRELAIVLPTGREAGAYVLDVSPDSDNQKLPLASYVGHASIDEDGVTTLRTPVDFKLFNPGTYTLAWHLQHSNFIQSGRFILQ